MPLTPSEWIDVSVDSYEGVATRFSTYEDIGPAKRWEFFYTGLPGTFTVPAGVNKIKVECIGGGGRSIDATEVSTRGGGGGSYAAGIFTVSEAQEYEVYVGRGAIPGEVEGQHSTFKFASNTLVLGAGGSSPDSQVHLCVGDIIYAGGRGGARDASQGSGGGAGGGAGPNGLGNNGEDGYPAGYGGSGGKGNGGVAEKLGRGGAGGRKAVEGHPGSPGSSSTPSQTITKNYPATWSKSWNIHGAHSNSPSLYQGWPQQDGNHYGKMGFNVDAIRDDLLGNTINSISLRMTLDHSWYTAGLASGLWLGTHTHFAMPGGTSPNTSGNFKLWTFGAGWNAEDTKTVALPSSVATSLRDKTIGGLTTGSPSSGTVNDYGYFYGYNVTTSKRPQLEIIYTIQGQTTTTSGIPRTASIAGQHGFPGRFPGGGGGGAGWGNNQNTLAGNGGNGYVRITEVA